MAAVTEEARTQAQPARANAYNHEYCTNSCTSILTRAPIHCCFRHQTKHTSSEYLYSTRTSTVYEDM
jgi:hypothetical protein